MKRNFIYYVAAMLAIIFAITFFKQSSAFKRELQSTQSILDEKQAVIKVVELENGRLKQEKQAAVVESRDKDLLIKNYKGEIEDLKKNHDVKVKNLHAYYKATTETSGSGEIDFLDFITEGVDESGEPVLVVKPIEIEEKYFNFLATYQNEKLQYSYTVLDSLSIAWHWEMKGMWPFKRKHRLMVSFSSANPNTRLLSATSIAIIDRKKTRLTIGPYVGFGTRGLDAGISVQYPLIRISW